MLHLTKEELERLIDQLLDLNFKFSQRECYGNSLKVLEFEKRTNNEIIQIEISHSSFSDDNNMFWVDINMEVLVFYDDFVLTEIYSGITKLETFERLFDMILGRFEEISL